MWSSEDRLPQVDLPEGWHSPEAGSADHYAGIEQQLAVKSETPRR
jgi:hypothetical protein